MIQTANTSGQRVPKKQASEAMGIASSSSPSKQSSVGKSLPTIACSPHKAYGLPANQQFVGFEIQPHPQSEGRSPKDSGYGSRLDTEDLQSPIQTPKPSPSKTASPVKKKGIGKVKMGSLKMKGQKKKGYHPSIPILTLANSPVLVNRSYLQFYYSGDPLSSWATIKEAPFQRKLQFHQNTRTNSPLPVRGRYPNRPLMPPLHRMGGRKRLLPATGQSVKGTSISSFDRLSFSSSLEEYATNAEQSKMNATVQEDSSETAGVRKERLLSVTRFQTLTTDLESPMSAQLVKLVHIEGSTSPEHTLNEPTSTAGSTTQSSPQKDTAQGQSDKQRLEGALQSAQPQSFSQNSMDAMLTAACQAKLRRGRGKRQRIEVRENLGSASSESFATGNTGPVAASTPKDSAIASHDHPVRQGKAEGLKREDKRGRWRRASEEPTRTSGSGLVQPLAIKLSHPYRTEVSKSSDRLSALDCWEGQKAKSAQSTTDLDLSQRVSETQSVVSLRPAYSVDDLTHPHTTFVDHRLTHSTEPPREGFLWRLLGRASQKWPAYVHIVCIQNSQAGVGGVCVRKGQQVRALYRVSYQVIVETETNHMASIPYQCCRISRKYYGQSSSLVQLSYSQLYSPTLEVSSLIVDHSPVHAVHVHGAGHHRYSHMPIEMVAIQDLYECNPLDEITVDSGDKLRVLYCDEKWVYAAKENREAGLLPRNCCRLTRKSQKMYQKWIDTTCSPFQADFSAKFSEPPPSFLTLKTEVAHGGNSPLPKHTTSKRSSESSDVCPSATKSGDVPASTHPLSPVRSPVPWSPPPHHDNSRSLHKPPITTNVAEASASLHPLSPHSNEDQTIAITTNSVQNQLVRTPSYAGKVMTVVRNYVPQTDMVNYTLRKGLRVKVLQCLEDGQTLRVMTKTGTQFNIPVSYLCLSRKNTDLNDFDATTRGANHNFPTESHNEVTRGINHSSSHGDHPASIKQAHSEQGKIMTIIRNFAPIPENPSFTIRRGLRVKVLSTFGDSVKVVTKSGTMFTLPRSYLRLAHKTSDTDAFASAPRAAMSVESLLSLNSNAQRSPLSRQHRGNNTNRVNSSPTSTHSDDQYTSSLAERREGTQPSMDTRRDSHGSPHSNLRGQRVNSAGSQVFELC